MARCSTRQNRGPNRLGFEEDLAHAEDLDQPANIANEQDAENDPAPARVPDNEAASGNQPPPRQRTTSPAQYYCSTPQHSNTVDSIPSSTVSGSSQQPTRTYNSNYDGSNSITYSVGNGKKVGVECYTCHNMGHYSWQCRSNTRTPMVQSKATTRASVQGNARPQNNRSISHTSPATTQGRLNHVQTEANEEVLEVDTVEEAYEDQEPQEETDPQYGEAC
uniref:CCHC-type domain-containing protein n=1 Tax=Oryza punctata TaxID=4537 RepID=A0A0E0LRP5_ORYPU